MSEQEWHRFDGKIELGGGNYLQHRRLTVVGETRCGVWLQQPRDKRRWVSRTARAKFAYPTEAEALESLIARKRRQIAICDEQIDRAYAVIRLAEQRAAGEKA